MYTNLIEQGKITIPNVWKEPEEMLAEISRASCVTSANACTSRREKSVSRDKVLVAPPGSLPDAFRYL